MKELTDRHHFIENCVRHSPLIKMAIKFTYLHHELINRGGFEDFIEIPDNLVKNLRINRIH